MEAGRRLFGSLRCCTDLADNEDTCSKSQALDHQLDTVNPCSGDFGVKPGTNVHVHEGDSAMNFISWSTASVLSDDSDPFIAVTCSSNEQHLASSSARGCGALLPP